MAVLDLARHAGAMPGIPELDLRALGNGNVTPLAASPDGLASARNGATPALQATGRTDSTLSVATRRAPGSPVTAEHVWHVLDTVLDPEVPAVSIRELGIVRDVRCDGEDVEVVLTPTYSGCPATEMIEAAVRDALNEAGYVSVTVSHRRAPAWTTDWITDEGRRKLREYGIAPPTGNAAVTAGASAAQPLRFVSRRAMAPVACPRCASDNTERLSAFGSTACKALYRCRACREPFEYFKPI